jgi:crotonobetainyl-CoA:carnitine CoA-transferase CaiB-like acyl-CoA transferase
MRTSIAVTDILAGLNATIGILAAIEHRHLTGCGQRIDIALLDTIVSFGSSQIANFFTTGTIPRRLGNEHPNLTPYQTFSTADGHIIIGCGNDGQYRRLCSRIGRADLANDPRFATMQDRHFNRQELQQVISEIVSQHGTAHWLDALHGAGFPYGPINNYQQVFEHPQVVHRGLRIDMEHPAGGTIGIVRNPIRLSATPIEYRHAPPLRGQHTLDILTSVLGKDADTIRALRSAGVVESALPSAPGAGDD